MNNPLFDLHRAYALSNLALEAYDSRTVVEARLRPAGTQIKWIESKGTDTIVVVTYDGLGIRVAFRGTADLKNAVTDANCELVEPGWTSCHIHKGFAVALESVWNELIDLIESLTIGHAKENTQIWLTGHSLGGALAVLAAYRLSSRFKVAGVYTFGQPRVGGICFKQLYDDFAYQVGRKTWRITHPADIVPMVPFMLGLFKHVGHHVTLTSRKVKTDPGALAELIRYLRSLWQDFRHGHLDGMLYEHHCFLYVEDLKKVLDREQ